ncbi:MAG: AAC(3) family N-acetyltransferase [Xanthobacteraceae bacterium]|nr:AAC(3) family N-acetyltransferase [Xanthobacteraceae bacterium]
MIVADLKNLLSAAIGAKGNPIVVYSAIWPLARSLGLMGPAALSLLLQVLDEVRDGRTLLMPTHTAPDANSFCDLDATASLTGLLSEGFRKQPDVRRTVSAYFSYAAVGPHQTEVVSLRPQDAWGDGSLFEWMEKEDVTFLMLGCHPTHCSYLHRMEWLEAPRIPYRYSKSMSNTVRHEGHEFKLGERLFVRSLAPSAVNDFTVLLPALTKSRMQISHFAVVQSRR